MLSFALPDLLRLLYAALLLGRFSTGPDAPLLDATHLRSQANLKHYLDAVVDKFNNILIDMDNPTDHYLLYMSRLFADTKKWYTSSVASMIAIDEDLFRKTPLLLDEKAHKMTWSCVDIPDGSENCPDYEIVRNRTRKESDPLDAFINWEDVIT